MQQPTVLDPQPAAPDTTLLGSYLPVPGLGVLPTNSFVIHAEQPVLVDAGVVALRDAYLQKLTSAIDIQDLRWLWLTHTDPDHMGAVFWLLDNVPQLRVVTTYLGMGKLGLLGPIHPDRVFLLNPGQELDVGDRRLLALQPPSFDAPETTALFDLKSGNLFSSDCFGGVLSDPVEEAEALTPEALTAGIVTWTGIDAPWLASLQEALFKDRLESIRRLRPSRILSSHLPPAQKRLDLLLEALVKARQAPPFVGPDQAALERMIRAA